MGLASLQASMLLPAKNKNFADSFSNESSDLHTHCMHQHVYILSHIDAKKE